MSKIQVLPEVLANKIAAGEIIERPASVVKELLENSIDAGSSTVEIVIEAGGKKLMLVRDNGEGMSQDDAILAFEHHATSKLRTADDLTAIATLGFRGEALPSIASVSHLTLRTKDVSAAEASPGTEIDLQGGTLRSVKPIAWNRGTEVAVQNLFYNMPARRKFLRSHETELGHITRLVTQYALACPGLRCRLETDGRVPIDVSPAPTVRERVYQLFGDDFLRNLVEFDGRSESLEVLGFCSAPHEQRTNPYSLFYYVNGRMVRDKVIMSAVRQAYQNCIPASAYPIALVFINLPHDLVDVNAHPAKTEIRFRDQSAVHRLVRDSVERALTKGRYIAPFQSRPEMAAVPPQPPATPDLVSPVSNDALFGPTVPSNTAQVVFQRAFEYPFREVSQRPAFQEVDHDALRIRPDMLWGADPQPLQALQLASVRILGQIYDSYIIASDTQGLLIIDQHVAHERILYEELAAAVRRDGAERQGLLVPISVELAPHQLVLLQQVMPELSRSGFDVEQFGGNTVLIRSVPRVAKECDVRKMLAEILDGLEREERTLDLDRIRDRVAVSVACRAAIKVHMPLTMEKMQWLLDELSQTRVPTNCPHGRPILLRFSLYEIERNFGRI
jgi:DNA mismatch repair protein MutL